MKINSQIQLGKQIVPYEESKLRYEPMLFSCDYETAYKLGGPPTREFLYTLPQDWHNENTIIDSRVHMLMPGWYPCIPGFHHDDVPRERSDGQPEYFNPSYRSEHAMILYNGGICPTEFALGEAEFPDVPLGETYYKVWHPLVMEKLSKAGLPGGLLKFSAPENQIIFFNDRTWHQGVKAVKSGWRLFIRASRNTNRKALNEERKQVQVYLENPMEGW
jgi:hypothetical protein